MYSRRTIEAVIDSLNLGVGVQNEVEWDELIERIRWNLRTARKSINSFSISYLDTDPVRAQRMVSLLAKVFIETRIQGEMRRNETAVQFFEAKLKEYRERFEATQEEMVGLLLRRMRELPTGRSGLTSQLESLDKGIRNLEEKLREDQVGLDKLETFPEAFRTDQGRQTLSELRRSSLPYVDELRAILSQYDEVTSRYTPLYPEVGKIESQILDNLRKMRVAVDSEVDAITRELEAMRTSRGKIVKELMEYSVDQQVDTDKESNFQLYQRLYEDMKTKLEQAKITRELGRNAENSFIIIDPARVPAKPTKPNRRLIIAGGFVFGFVLGLALTLAAELFDTRIRTVRDVEVYQLPVIALLPDAQIRR